MLLEKSSGLHHPTHRACESHLHILDFSFQDSVYLWKTERKEHTNTMRERNRFCRSRSWTKPSTCSGNRDMRVPLLRILFSAWALDAAVCMTPSATSMRSIWLPSRDTLPNTRDRSRNCSNKRDPSLRFSSTFFTPALNCCSA